LDTDFESGLPLRVCGSNFFYIDFIVFPMTLRKRNKNWTSKIHSLVNWIPMIPLWFFRIYNGFQNADPKLHFYNSKL